LTVNGQDPGAVIALPAAAPTVHIRAEARTLGPLNTLEIMANHTVLARSSQSLLETDLSLPVGGWLLARCRGSEGEALTSPVYVRVEGERRPADPATFLSFADYLDKMLDWVAHESRFENEAQPERLSSVFRSARDKLMATQY
jgi:hypothetical protein